MSHNLFPHLLVLSLLPYGWCQAQPANPTQSTSYPGRPDRSQSAEIAKAVGVQVDTIQTPASGARQTTVSLQLHNLCQKAVYSISYSVKAVYADGSDTVSRGQGFDLLPTYIQSGLDGSQNTASLLRPGETYRTSVSVTVAKDGSAPVAATVEILMILFEDRTALGDAREIQSVLRMRAQAAQWYAGVAEDLKTVARSTNIFSAIEARRQDLLAGRVAIPSGDRSVPGLRAGTLQNVANNLRVAGSSRIGFEIARYQSLAAAEIRHSTLDGGAQ